MLKKANRLHQDACADCYLASAVAYFHIGQMEDVVRNCDKTIAAVGDDPMRAAADNLKGNALFSLAGADSKTLLAAQNARPARPGLRSR